MLRTVLAALVAVTANLAAQGRTPIVGRTTLADGTVWAEATIVLQSFVHPEWPQLGVMDRIEVRSDAQGRFRADALPARSYEAFAFELDPGRRQRCSQLAAVGAAQPAELRATHDWQPAAKLQLTGTAPYAAHRLRVHWPAAFAAAGDVDADDRVDIPPLPRPWVDVAVTTDDGHLLLRRTIGLGAPHTLELPPPSPYLVRALDGPDGAPIADAEVLLCWDSHQERLGTTAADGFAVVDLACLRHGDQIPDARFRLRVHAAGRELGLVHATDETARTLEDLAAMRAKGASQAFATLSPGKRHHGRVMLDATAPAAMLPLLVAANATVRHLRGASSSNRVVRILHTAVDGTFTLDDVVADGPLQVFAVLPPALATKLSDAATALVPIANFTGVVATRHIPQNLGTTVLGELQPCSLQLRTPDGAPALDAGVYCAVPSMSAAPPVGGPDRKGRFTLLLPPKVGIDVAIATAEASWLGRVGGLTGGGAVTVPITLWPDRQMTCTVEDRDGKLASAQLTIEQISPEIPWQLSREAMPGLVAGPDYELLPMLRWLPTRSRRESDGSCRVGVPNVPGRWFVRASTRANWGSVEFDVEAGTTELPALRVRLDRP